MALAKLTKCQPAKRKHTQQDQPFQQNKFTCDINEALAVAKDLSWNLSHMETNRPLLQFLKGFWGSACSKLVCACVHVKNNNLICMLNRSLCMLNHANSSLRAFFLFS